MDYLKTIRWTLYTTGGILILLGILSFFFPEASLMTLAVCVGVGFILAGINNLVPYFSLRGSPFRPAWLLPQGILDILLGVLMLTRIGLTSFMIPVLLGFWMIFTSVLRLSFCLQLRRAGLRKWWLMPVSAIAMLFCSLVMISSPVAGVLVVSWSIGTALVCAGLVMLAEARLIYKGR